MGVKSKFKITVVDFNLIYIEKGEFKREKKQETYLHKRTPEFINNCLDVISKKNKAIGFEITEVKVKNVISIIPFDVLMEYKKEVKE